MMKRARVASLVISSALILAPSLALASFDQDLQYGDKGARVSQLQQFLKDRGIFAEEVTGNFYAVTLAGVKTLQSQQGITASGFFGPLTRARANGLLSGSAAISTSTNSHISVQIAALTQLIQQLKAQIASFTKAPAWAAAPVVSLTANGQDSIELSNDETFTLAWRSSNVASCALETAMGSSVMATAPITPNTSGTSPGDLTGRQYKYTLTRVGSNGQRASKTVTVRPKSSTSLAWLSVSPAAGPVPLRVQFSVGGSGTFTVDFGDGSMMSVNTIISQPWVSHTYTAPGTYIAKLLQPQHQCQTGNEPPNNGCLVDMVLGTATITATE